MALVGGVSHTSAGGLLPHVAVTALVVLGCVALSAVFLTGPASPLRVVALLVGGQTGVHVALTLAAGHVGDAATTVPLRSGSPLTPASVDGRRVGSLMEQTTAPAAATPGVDASLLAHLQGQGLGMLAAHTAAAIALGLWLALGEKALWRVLPRPAPAPLPAGPPGHGHRPPPLSPARPTPGDPAGRAAPPQRRTPPRATGPPRLLTHGSPGT